jgi:membrane associated rhomboid family serine protease
MIPVRDTTVKRGFAPVTAILIILNLVMFFEELKMGEPLFREFRAAPLDLYQYLIKGTSSFLRIHRSILVSGFMHSGYIHLIGNLIFLSVFGPPVEKHLGIIRFSIFYLLSIFFSFYAHVMVYPQSPVPVMGASGAIAAVMGSYLVLYPRGRILTIIPLILMLEVVEIPSIIFILIWFAIQGANGYLSIQTQSSIAWFSHIGGFLFGFINGVHERWFRL